MANSLLLKEIGEYTLLFLFYLFLVSSLRRGGILLNSRAIGVVAILMIFSLASSKYWPLLRDLYIYAFAAFALLGSFFGSMEIIFRSKMAASRTSFLPFRYLEMGGAILILLVSEYADTLLAPVIQANIPFIWWRAGAWIIPSVGLAKALKDPARASIQALFPQSNTRLILFVFIFAAGLLVPLYFPSIDRIMKICTMAGIILGVIFPART
jgi:hypothetical protein